MKITIIGLGYVGLTTAACLSKEHEVICVDKDEKKIKDIQLGKMPFFEEGLNELIRIGNDTGKLEFTCDLQNAIQNSEISIICVGTPSLEDGQIDLTQIDNVIIEIGKSIKKNKGYHILTIKSTVIPGTSINRIIPMLEKNSGLQSGKQFGVCVCPEFLREGQAVKDFLDSSNTGVIIGELNKRSGNKLTEVFSKYSSKLIRTDLTAAEMIKYARNAYLAKDISFANMIANMCEESGIDYLDVKEGIQIDDRIGEKSFLEAGLGYGGSCFKKDLLALIEYGKNKQTNMKLLEETEAINEKQHEKFLAIVKRALGDLEKKEIAVLGASFKPNTDDIRYSKAIRTIQELIEMGVKITLYDPKAMKNAKIIFGDKISYASDPIKAISKKDAALILTEWKEFADPEIYKYLKRKIIIDGRRGINPEILGSKFKYFGIGYPNRN